jgi:hypothetical protein
VQDAALVCRCNRSQDERLKNHTHNNIVPSGPSTFFSICIVDGASLVVDATLRVSQKHYRWPETVLSLRTGVAA